jgi:Raf kinase inhibitor-like YbhB/YbcL family protein
MRRAFSTALLSCIVLLSACRHEATTRNAANDSATNDSVANDAAVKGEGPMTLKLRSTVFQEGGMIPSKHTCDGEDASPPLLWSGVPDSAKSLALVCEDPDAPRGIWTHWVVYGIPATAHTLPAALPARETLDDHTHQGKNDFQKIGYGGPCPPSGTHRYYFKLYALDTTPDLPPAPTKDQLLKAIEGHTLAQGELMARYTRTK